MIFINRPISFKDIVDILIVTFIIYKILVFLKPTKAYNVLKGLLIIIVLYFIVSALHLTTITWIIQRTMELGVLALVIVFQPELRMLLAKLGREGIVSAGIESSSIEKIIKSLSYLAEKQIGAIIVIERGIGLGNYVENGVKLNAQITSELLNSIFSPGNILHDGAAIIQGNKISAAACFLPIAKNVELSVRYGSRHRAAAGISEESDAFVIVVSEETGLVSYSEDGFIYSVKSLEAFEQIMMDKLLPKQKPRGKIYMFLSKMLKKWGINE